MGKYVGRLNSLIHLYKNSFINLKKFEKTHKKSLLSLSSQGMMMWIAGKVVDGSIFWKQS